MVVLNNHQFNIPNNETDIAVGLSGGGDSMALAHMMCEWAKDNGRNIHLLSVDHNLRDESVDEAKQIASWVSKFSNCEHHILTWEHAKKPVTAVMEQARQARYKLMKQYCDDHNIKTCAVAHHGDDQIETFFFRLAKGSGLDGLSGMREWGDFEDLKIYRPLLSHSHDDLIEYCLINRLDWMEDPSNENYKYARPRLRKALENEGLSVTRFTKTLSRISRGREALEWMASKFYNEYVDGNKLNWDELQNCPIDLIVRVLQKTLIEFGEVKSNYPPKMERIEEIIATIKPSKSATLYGCVLTLSNDGKTLEIKQS